MGGAISPDEPPEGDIMQIQVNTDGNIEGRDALTAQVEADIRDGLSRFADQITRVEVHLSDENAGKGGNDDIRCLLEVRLTGQQPVAVTHQGGTLQVATAGAVQKMQRKLQSTFGRQNNAKGGHSIRDLETL
jgi:ribosome-associated translation inhibitor RaiA